MKEKDINVIRKDISVNTEVKLNIKVHNSQS